MLNKVTAIYFLLNNLFKKNEAQKRLKKNIFRCRETHLVLLSSLYCLGNIGMPRDYFFSYKIFSLILK